MEALPLKLAAEHFPLPGSLRELVLKRYIDRGAAGSGMQAMDLEELIGYLRTTQHLSLSPMQSILAQTESIGDPALPTAEQMAILQWAGIAFEDWEQRFPLEQPLCSQLRRLKPLAATLAIVDPAFLTPGDHPLHRLLDNLQLAAVGWQARLGRAGQALENTLVGAVEEALTWFETRDTDLAALAARVIATTERDLARASRMAQRMIEAEEGRIKTAEAKCVAAQMINAVLQTCPAPPGIGKFLKGPWYDSAQLVLLKFGPESEQWAQMSATTGTLLDSVTVREGEEDPARRQQLFETVTQLPRELRRWLLSLQHNGDAVENALGVVEYAHMQILRKRPLELEQTELIPVTASAKAAAGNALESTRTGQWFSIDLDEGDPVRARLVLRMEQECQLLFANQAGIKVLQQSFEDFAGLLASDKVSILDSGVSFSRSLARAAGIENTADLDTLLSATVLQARREEEERQRLEQEQRRQEQAQAEQLASEQQAQARLQQESEQAARREQELENEARLKLEQREAEALQREWDEARRLKQERQEAGRSTPTAPAAAEIPAKAGAVATRPGPPPAGQGSATPQSPALALPMGTWLGFHDGDTPLLAKLAVHDRENNNYIFVNRSGIKMRELNSHELLLLMEKGMVDVLETRSNFRDQITRVKNKSDD